MRSERLDSQHHSRAETRGSAIAHGSALLIGLPLWFFLPLYIALIPCPVVAYMISRFFRRRKLAWGAFHGMQAAVMHLLILALIFVGSLADMASNLGLSLWTSGVVLFLYSLWGTVDTLLGYDFRYLGISSLVDRVSQANLDRQERRRRWFGGWSGKDNQDR